MKILIIHVSGKPGKDREILNEIGKIVREFTKNGKNPGNVREFSKDFGYTRKRAVFVMNIFLPVINI